MNGNAQTILWRRLDRPGHEACRLTALGAGWQLAGGAVFAHEGQACRLDYAIACDEQWRTLSALVSGWVGERDVEIEVVRDAAGLWRLNGDLISAVEGCVDVDLNFSPSTNTLPIRRFDLEVGHSVHVRAAWLRFPSFQLEPLEQSYTRVGANLYRYESAGGRFVASVEVDAAGLVTEYGEIWVREGA
ncbi:MAG TPA: putative glycolipid-binding domain-containing protein [Thermoanaerobaculia bacterium]